MLLRVITVVFLIILAAAVATWASFPLWSARLVTLIDPNVRELTVSRPGVNSLLIQSAHYETGALSTRLLETRVTWQLRNLFRGKVESIDVTRLEIGLAGMESTEATGSNTTLPDPWQLIPAKRLTIDSIDIALPSNPVTRNEGRITGTVRFDATDANALLTIASDALHEPIRVEARATPASGGYLALSLAEQPLLAAQLAMDASGLLFDGDLTIDSFSTVLPFVRSFFGIPGDWQGTLNGPVTGRVPLDGDWQGATFDASFALEGQGSIAGATGIRARGTSVMSLEAGALSVRIDDGELTADAWRNFAFSEGSGVSGSASISFPDVMSLVLADARIEGSLRTHIGLSREPPVIAHGPIAISGTVEAPKIEIGSGAVISTTVGGDATELLLTAPLRLALMDAGLTTEPARLRVNLPPVPVAGQSIDIDAGSLRLESMSVNFGEDPGYKVNGSFRPIPADDAITLDFRVNGGLKGNGRFEGSINHDIAASLLHRQIPGWSLPVDLSGGRLEANLGGGFDLNAEGFGLTAAGSIGINRGVGRYENSRLEGLDVALPIRIDGTAWQLGPGDVSAATVNVGIAMTDLKTELTVRPEAATLDSFSIAVFGGRASSEKVTWGIERGEAMFEVALDGLSLEQILSIEGYDVVGTGTLDGKLPVRITTSGFSIDRGSVASRTPGGRIAYDASFGGTDTPGLGIAMRALRDFNYTELRGKVSYAPDGALELGLDLRGRSPNVESGRPIHFNLNISENLKDLLRSLRAAERMNERIQQEFSQ